MATTASWYYEILDEQFGPISTDDLRQLLRDGMLSPSDRVRRSIESYWKQASDEEELSEAVRSSDEFRERHADLNIDAFNIVGDSETAGRAQRFESSDSASFVLKDESGPATLDPPDQDDEDVSDEPGGYRVRISGKVSGPLTLAELIDLAKSGGLSKGDQIQPEDSDWISVDSIPGLSAAVSSPDVDLPKSAPGLHRKPRRRSKSQRPLNAAERKRVAQRRRRRQKRAQKEDALLQGIFAEVFTDDGAVRPEIRNGTARSPAASGPQPEARVTNPPSAPVAALSQNTTSTPAPAASLPATVGAPSANPHPAPVFKPQPKKKSSSEDSRSTTLMVGAGIAVFVCSLLVGGFMGFIPVPSLGPAWVDPGPFLTEVSCEFENAHNGSDDDWREFTGKYRVSAMNLTVQLKSESDEDAKAKYFEPSKLALDLLRMSHFHKDLRKKKFDAMVASLSPQS